MSRSFVHRVLLAAARDELDPQRVADAGTAQRDLLLRRSRDHAMQGLVARPVRRIATLEPWAVPFVEQAIGIREGHLQHVRTLKLAVDTFETRSIPRLLVKGPSLVERYYHDDALRSYGDVDVLVPAHRFGDALDVLEERGFTVLDRNWHMLRRDLRGQLHLRSPERDLLELHWHVVNSDRVRHALSVAMGDLWHTAQSGVVGGVEVSVPDAPRELAHLCMHAAMHGCDRLIWLVDIARVASAPGLDLDELQRTARRWGFGAGTYLVLALTGRWLGLALLMGELKAIRPDRPTLTAFDRLVGRWDLGHPGADARLRQLLFASAGDGFARRMRLTWSLVVPPDVADPDRGGLRAAEHLRRVTTGAASRIQQKLEEHTQYGVPIEYLPSGDRLRDRERYLGEVAAMA